MTKFYTLVSSYTINYSQIWKVFIAVRLPFDYSSSSLQLDDLHYDRRPTCCCLLHCGLNKKVLRETQTLCAGCSKTDPKNFAPLQTSFPGAQNGQNL